MPRSAIPAVIQEIMDWITGLREDDREAVILWFYVPAGAGKFAVARKIAELGKSEKHLLAGFFFSRADLTRNPYPSSPQSPTVECPLQCVTCESALLLLVLLLYFSHL